jgi:hypothetical protein
MYRKNDGRMGFSLNRMVTNMFPNFASEMTIVEMSQTQQDALFRWQLSQENPKVLHDHSFFMGGVTGTRAPPHPRLRIGPSLVLTLILNRL